MEENKKESKVSTTKFTNSIDHKFLNEIQIQLSQEKEEADLIASLKDKAKDKAKDEFLKNSRPILIVNNLVKKYGSKFILKGLSFKVLSGEIVGILGENAAGKTTLFKCFSHSTDCEGEIIIDRVNHDNSPSIGLLWVESGMDPDITLRDNLKFYSLRVPAQSAGL